MINVNWIQHVFASIGSEALHRLDFSLSRTDRGFEGDIRTPFYNGAPRSYILDKLINAIGEARYSELRGIDNKEIENLVEVTEILEDLLNTLKQAFGLNTKVRERR